MEDGSKISYGGIYGLYNVKTLYIEEGIQNILNDAFYGMSSYNSSQNLENIILPQSITTIGNSVFSACIKLKKINIPNGVISIG